MKRIHFALALWAVTRGFLCAQVVTQAVGFTTINSSANTDTPVSLALHRPSELESTVVNVSGNVITISAGLTANQFAYAAGSQTNHYYVSVKTSSAVAGKWYEILSNTGETSNATITVDPGSAATLQTQGLLQGDTIQVIPFWTLNTLFPGGQGLTVTTDIDSPQDLVLQLPQSVAGTNLAAERSSLYSTDTANLGTAGWYDANSFDSVGDDPILPDSYLVIRNKGASQPITLTGSVPQSNRTTNIVRLSTNKRQDNFIANPFPVPISLQELNLYESGVFEATADIDAPKDQLLVYTGTETGFNAQPSKAYIYSTDTANLPQAGWYDANTFEGPFTNSQKLIPVGGGLIVRKAIGAIANLTWTAPKPY